MNREVVIIMPYIGSVLSVNHYLGRGAYGKPYLKKEVVAWKAELGWKIKPYHIEEWALPLTVTCNGVFRDLRSCPDLSNLAKVVLDAIEETTGINDRNMRWQDGNIKIDKEEKPHLEIIIEQFREARCR